MRDFKSRSPDADVDAKQIQARAQHGCRRRAFSPSSPACPSYAARPSPESLETS